MEHHIHIHFTSEGNEMATKQDLQQAISDLKGHIDNEMQEVSGLLDDLRARLDAKRDEVEQGEVVMTQSELDAMVRDVQSLSETVGRISGESVAPVEQAASEQDVAGEQDPDLVDPGFELDNPDEAPVVPVPSQESGAVEGAQPQPDQSQVSQPNAAVQGQTPVEGGDSELPKEQ